MSNISEYIDRYNQHQRKDILRLISERQKKFKPHQQSTNTAIIAVAPEYLRLGVMSSEYRKKILE
jgi:hypothetical protein